MAKVLAVVASIVCGVAAYEQTIANLPKSGYIHRTRWMTGVNLSWTLGLQTQELHVKLEVPVPANSSIGWVSVGWSTTGTMGGSDLVFGYVPPSGLACIRPVAFVVAPDPGPNKPGSFNITGGSFSIDNGVARLIFTRPLASGQPHPKNVVKTDGPQMIMFGAASAKPHRCKAGLPDPPSMCGGVPDNCEDAMGPTGLVHVHDLLNEAAFVDFSTGELHPEGPNGALAMV